MPLYGETQIATPNIDRLAAEGITFTNAVSSCPLCTPYRSMLLTGRHPQSTGHVVNFVRTRHDEIGIGDAFSHAGYRTGWIGKWHLHTGSFPQIEGEDFVPRGRDRLGFEYWRAYNFHSEYFNGWVNTGDWGNECWQGYETEALTRYVFEFLEETADQPFCLFLSPHQPHYTYTEKFAPEKYYENIPEQLALPGNVPDSWKAESLKVYKHYLAMVLALDAMVGQLIEYLDKTSKRENTLVVLTSDHGTQMGANGIAPWAKKNPYMESLKVPFIMSLPGVLEGGCRRNPLIAPVDIFPTLCALSGIPIPKTVEGYNLSEAVLGIPGAFEQDCVLTMNFSKGHDYLLDGQEWRGLINKKYIYNKWLDGKIELFDIEADPLLLHNEVNNPQLSDKKKSLEKQLEKFLVERGDAFQTGYSYRSWFDPQRRVCRNGFGFLGDPEKEPDWSLLA